MKARSIIPALLILGTGVAVQFADGQPRGGRPGRLADALELTEDQRTQLAQLREQHREAVHETMEGIRAQVEAGDLTREEAREQARTAREARRDDLDEILTPEQLQRLDELRAARQERDDGERKRSGPRMGYRRHPGRGHGPGHLIEALDLSGDQQAQLKALREQHRESVRETMDGIRAQVEAGDLTREEARDQARAAREAHRDDLAQILTPEQLQKLDEIRANHPKPGERTAAEGETLEMEQALTTGSVAPTAVQEESWGEIKKGVQQR